MFYEYSFTSNVFVCITNRRWGAFERASCFYFILHYSEFFSSFLLEFFFSFFIFYKPLTLLHYTSPLLNFALDIYYIINYSPINLSFRCLNFFKISSHQSSQLVGRWWSLDVLFTVRIFHNSTFHWCPFFNFIHLDFCTHASIGKKGKEGADSKTARPRKRKYWFLMDEEMIRCTNWWRRQRGMKPLHMPAGRIIGEVEWSRNGKGAVAWCGTCVHVEEEVFETYQMESVAGGMISMYLHLVLGS